jgi:hypothetical protein
VIESVNGSSSTGHCNIVEIAADLECREPTDSVLFDGTVPTLTGLDGDTWASQLLTVLKSSLTPEITFQVNLLGSTETATVEVVMFNCPAWGVAVESVRLLASPSSSFNAVRELQREVMPSISSCQSLIRLCIATPIRLPILTLQFNLPPGSRWVHLAEINIYRGAPNCEFEATVHTPLPTPEMTTTPLQPITTTDTTTATTVTMPEKTTMVTTRPEETTMATTPEETAMVTTRPEETTMATTPEETAMVTTPEETTMVTTPAETTLLVTTAEETDSMHMVTTSTETVPSEMATSQVEPVDRITQPVETAAMDMTIPLTTITSQTSG